MGITNYTQDKIELRSEKERQQIGDIPTTLVYWGISLMSH